MVRPSKPFDIPQKNCFPDHAKGLKRADVWIKNAAELINEKAKLTSATFEDWIKRVKEGQLELPEMELDVPGFDNFRFDAYVPARGRVWVKAFTHDGVKHGRMACPLDNQSWEGCVELVNRIVRGLEQERQTMETMGYWFNKKEHDFRKCQEASWGEKYWIWIRPCCGFEENLVFITYDFDEGGRKTWKKIRLQTSSAVQAMIHFEQHINPLLLFERNLPPTVTKRMVEQEQLDKWATGDGTEWIWRWA